MKKFYLLVLIAFSFVLNAQKTFTPGFRAGVNFSTLSQSMSNDNYRGYYTYEEVTNTKMRTDFYVGFQGNIRIRPYYAIQPEINYSRQGTKERII